MSTFTKRVITGDDDAEQRTSSPFGMDLISSDLELHDRTGTDDGYVGMRWTNVTIPQGAIIDSAKIQFHVDEVVDSSVSLTVTFRGEDIDDAAVFTTTASNLSDRAETTASVDWAIPTWVNVNDEGAAQLSVELKTIVQEIVDRVGWNSGQAMVIMIKAWVDNTGKRHAESYNGETASAAELQVTYHIQIVADPGSFSFTGIASGTIKDSKLPAISQSFSLTGIIVNLIKGVKIAASSVAFVLTGIATNLKASRKIAAVAGSFNFTGIAASLNKGFKILASSAAFILTGIAVNLNKGFKILADSVSFVLTGITANLIKGVRIIASSAAFALTGIVTNVIKNSKVIAASVAFALNGIAANLKADRKISATVGNFNLTGIAIVFSLIVKLLANTGAFILTGISATLSFFGQFKAPTVVLTEQAISISLTEQAISMNLTEQAVSISLTEQEIKIKSFSQSTTLIESFTQ